MECTRCGLTDFVPAIEFDEKGECNYCKLHDDMDKRYPTGYEGLKKLRAIADKVTASCPAGEPNVIVGVSGGSDSSFMLHMCKQLDLNPIAVNYDNGYGTGVGLTNLKRVTRAMKIPLEIHKVDQAECDFIYKAFFNAGVIDLEAPADIGLASALHRAAEKHGIKYIFEGHNFRTEGVSPLGWMYMDGRYIQDVVNRQFGGRYTFKTYPNMTLWDMLRWKIYRRIRLIRPLYYLTADKKRTKEILEANYDWKDYGACHHENIITRYWHEVFCPENFHVWQPSIFLAAQVRSGYITKQEASLKASQVVALPKSDLITVRKRIGVDLSTFVPTHTYRDFKTYKKTFERLRLLFWVLAKLDLMPWSFYAKYTKKGEI